MCFDASAVSLCVNLLPYLTGQKSERPHETLYWRFGPQWAIRHGDWKLVKANDIAQPALFNLAADISEKNDLAAQESAKAAELKGVWDAWNAEQKPPLWERTDGKKKKGGKGQGKVKAKA